MRKKFVSAMAFGAMILASSPVLVSCSDYDDDIDRLQNQVDGIKGENPVTPAELQAALDAAKADYQAALELALTGKADNAAVQALQAKVNELNDALNGKADAATVEGILNDIRTLSEEVNSVKGGLDGVKSELQGEIDALKDKIAGVESGAATKAELKEQLDAAVAELNAKIAAADNTADIEALNGKLTELKNAQDALSGKLDADKTELTGKIADALAKAEEAAAKAGDAATKAEVEALKSKVDALEGTVASNEALNGIKSELEGKIAEAMAKAQEAAAAAGNAASAAAFEELKGTVETLSGKIDELTSKPSLTEADVRSMIQAELTSSLTDLNNKMVQVENSISNNARAIAELTQKIAKIAEIESTLTDYESRLALVESGKASKQDLTDLATRVGTLETSMQGLSETIGSYLTANSYAKLSDIDSKLSTQLAGYYTKSEVDQAIQNKIDAAKQLTEAEQKAVQEVFANLDTKAEGFKTYAELLGEVATLNAKFAEDGDVAALKTGLGDLDKKFNEFVNSANAAIQSIVFMPEYTDRMVKFQSLIATGTLTRTGGNVSIASETEKIIKFRVTPAAAADDLCDESKYKINFYGHEMMSRAMKGNEYITPKKIENKGDGVVEVTIGTGSANTMVAGDKYAAISMHVMAVEQKDDEGNKKDLMQSDITSDYFTLAVSATKIKDVTVVSPANTTGSVRYNDNAWSKDYAAGRSFFGVLTNGSLISLANFDMDRLGSVTYEKTEFDANNRPADNAFKLVGGTLNYLAGNGTLIANIDSRVIVSATYQFNNSNVNPSSPSLYAEVKVVRAITEKKYEYTIPSITWTEAHAPYVLPLADVQNASGLAADRFTTLSDPDVTSVQCGNQTLQITGTPSTGYSVTIPQYISMKNVPANYSGKKALSLKYIVDNLNTFEIVVYLPNTSVFPEVEITRNENWWDGNNMVVPATEDRNVAGKITDVKLTSLDYSTKAYLNYTSTYQNELRTKGLKYDVAVTPAIIGGVSVNGVTISGTNVTVDKSTFNGGAACKVADIKASIKLNQNGLTDALAVNNGSIVVEDLSGNWAVTKTAFTVQSLSDKIQLAEGCTWTSRLGDIMWKAGKEYDASVNGSKFAVSPMSIYGLTAPVFTKVTDPDHLATVNAATGELSFVPNAKDFLLQKDYTITVKSTIKSSWGKYSTPVENTYTITIPKGTK